jgi:hypothetical protein
MASKGGAAGAAGKAGAKKAGQQAGGGAGKSPTKPEPPINMPPAGDTKNVGTSASPPKTK